MFNRRWLLLLLVTSACASDAPGRVRPPSVPAHPVRAVAGRTQILLHARADDPAQHTLCGERVCWTSSSNPTQPQLEQLAELRYSAAMLRTSTRALSRAEARACAGLDDEERDVSPFYHRDDIVDVVPLSETARTGKGRFVRTSGARVDFRAVPGLTAERLRRQVSCQMARAAAVEHVLPEPSHCPLALSGIEANVRALGTGFAVEITAEDARTVDAILRRAYALQDSPDRGD